MGSLIDMTSMKIGRLTVLYRDAAASVEAKWRCKCECGADVVVGGYDLRRKTTISCGCQRIDMTVERSLTHGLSRTREHRIWLGIIRRCTDERRPEYPSYGGRGITVCERWQSFENFIADMGKAPSNRHSIDRIDNDRGYEPSNCRWATPKEQRANRRDVNALSLELIEVRRANAAAIAEIERLTAEVERLGDLLEIAEHHLDGKETER